MKNCEGTTSRLWVVTSRTHLSRGGYEETREHDELTVGRNIKHLSRGGYEELRGHDEPTVGRNIKHPPLTRWV